MLGQEIDKYRQKAKRGCPDFHRVVADTDAFRLHKFRDLQGQDTSPVLSTITPGLHMPTTSRRDEGTQHTPLRDRLGGNNPRGQVQVCGGVVGGNAAGGSTTGRPSVVGAGPSAVVPTH